MKKAFYRCIKRAEGIRLHWVMLIILGFILPPEVFGDESFRCQGHIISIGDDKTEVLDSCGEANHSEKWEEWHYVEEDVYATDTNRDNRNDKRYHHRSPAPPDPPGSPGSPVMVKQLFRMERWVYNFGTTQFKRYLKFRNDELIKIETGDKGSN